LFRFFTGILITSYELVERVEWYLWNNEI
jgi:hypothetical protein